MKSKASKPTDPAWRGGAERLHKLLARAGYGSRRSCEDLMQTGRVTVDGEVASTPGSRANPAEHDIRVDGERISFPKRVCYLLNKPTGYICTNDDELERNSQRAIDLIDDPTAGRLYTVGRLDKESEGLILITNDGELTQKLTHPSFRVPRLYRVAVRGEVTGNARNQLLSGVWLADGKLRPENIRIRTRSKKSTVLELTLTEGKNREIRRIFARVNHPVSRLQRVRVGSLELGDLPVGQHRRLSEEDIDLLFRTAEAYRTGKLKVKRDKPRAHEGEGGSAKPKPRQSKRGGAKQANAAAGKPEPKTSRKKTAGAKSGGGAGRGQRKPADRARNTKKKHGGRKGDFIG